MICPNCGQVTVDSEICAHCGAALGAEYSDEAERDHRHSDTEAPSAYIPFNTGSGVMNIFGVENLTAPLPAVSSQAPATSGHLVVHFNAENWGAANERVIPLEGQEITIGRSPGCVIVLPDDFLVSRHHAIIRARDTGYVLIDLGSSNGTVVNGEQVAMERPLYDGDEIRIGDCSIIYSTTPAPEMPAPTSGAGTEGGAWDRPTMPGSLEMVTAHARTPTIPLGGAAMSPVEIDHDAPAASGKHAAQPTVRSESDATAAIASLMEGDSPALASGVASAASPVADLDALQTQLTDMVGRLRQQAETATRQVEHLKSEIATITVTLATLLETQRQLANNGPDLTALLEVTARTVENPRHLDNVVEFVSHAAEIDVALRALRDMYSNSGIIAAVDSLRARLADLG